MSMDIIARAMASQAKKQSGGTTGVIPEDIIVENYNTEKGNIKEKFEEIDNNNQELINLAQEMQAQISKVVTPENLVNISYLFADGRNEELRTKLDTSYAIVMDYTYRKFPYSETVPILTVKANNCESMQHGFDGAYCKEIEFIEGTPKLKVANHICNDCVNLESVVGLDLSEATTIKYSFYNCSSLATINIINSGKVEDMSYAFYGSGLTTVEGLDTSSVTNMDGTFANAQFTSLELDCGNVQTAKGTFFNSPVTNLVLNNIKVSFSVENLELDAEALNVLFTSLGTANTGATISIVGTTGEDSCDKTIAEEKGWNFK